MSALATRTLPRPPHTDPTDRGRAWLTRLFAGDFPFPAVPPGSLPVGDRTAAEHAAAARAAGCRDLFVVHADPVAGEKLIADVARAAPDRVLILSPHPAAADRVAERLLRYGVSVLRALADDENPLRPSPPVSKVTSVAIRSARVEQVRREAAAGVTAAEQRLNAFATVAKAVARLAEVTDRLKQLDADVADLAARRDRVEREVVAEAGTPFAVALAKLDADHADATARAASELQAATAVHADRVATLAKLKEQYAEIMRKPGLLSRLFGGKAKPGLSEPADLEKQIATLEADVAVLAPRAAGLQTQVDAAAGARAIERANLIAAEVATRRRESESALSAAEDERARARAEAAALNAVISAAVPGEDHAAAERQLAAARERAAEVARAAPEAGARAAAEPRVVVGIPGCLDADPVFAALPDDPPFGVLILDRAEELPEAEFPRLARLAERWVLVGEALPRDDRPAPGGPPPRAARNGRPAEPSFLARLAKQLDREAWATDCDRVVCRLAHLTADQRRGMTREPLADRPEIELRFASRDGEPVLAEVTFPAAMSGSAAKSWLFQELGEVFLRPCGEPVWALADALAVSWPAADGPDGVWIDLEPGVREKVAGVGPFAFTAAVQFDPAAGWDADKAAAWVAKHLPPSASRFAAMPRAAGPRPNA